MNLPNRLTMARIVMVPLPCSPPWVIAPGDGCII